MDDEDDYLDGGLDADDEHEEQKSSSLPTIDDAYLKYYARLVYNLNKLMEFKLDDLKKNLTDEFENENSSSLMSQHHHHNSHQASTTFDYLNSNNDQPLYCMKIIMLYSLLNQFRPDYWTLLNGENQPNIKKIYLKIKKMLALAKDSINCLFQVIPDKKKFRG